MWKRGDIAPEEQSPLFHNIFNISLKESNYILICEMWLFDLFFPQFCKSAMSMYGYLEVFQRSLGHRDNESLLYTKDNLVMNPSKLQIANCSLSVCLSLYLSVSLCVSLSVCLSVCLSLSLSGPVKVNLKGVEMRKGWGTCYSTTRMA